MKKRYRGIIYYRVDKNHPDIKYIKDPERVLKFEDVYIVPADWSLDSVKGYIKNDLALIAGGGYDTDHIHDVRFEIKSI